MKKVFISQRLDNVGKFNEKRNKWDLIVMTPEMYAELMEAWQSPEGSFVTNLSRRF